MVFGEYSAVAPQLERRDVPGRVNDVSSLYAGATLAVRRRP